MKEIDHRITSDDVHIYSLQKIARFVPVYLHCDLFAIEKTRKEVEKYLKRCKIIQIMSKTMNFSWLKILVDDSFLFYTTLLID